MADLTAYINALESSLRQLGKASLSSLFPRDFEYYFCALELATSEGDTIDYFAFPVMPNSITKTENERTTVNKTLGGTTILNTDSFVPKDISIKGDFGRTFKILIGKLGEEFVTARGLRFSLNSGIYYSDQVNSQTNFQVPKFNADVKTGYGCIKILQSMIDKAKGHDAGQPFRLYFYNLALNESYLVVPTKSPLVLDQNINNNNMVWGYTLNLQAIAPLDRIKFDNARNKSLSANLAQSVIQKSVNNVASTVAKYV